MTFAILALAAALSTAESAPKAEISNVRFGASTLMAVKAKSGPATYLRGPLRVDMSFRENRVRKPLLRIACLCEVDGELVCCSGLWDKLNTNRRLGRSEITKAFKQAGIELTPKEREAAMADPQKISPLLSEALKGAYQQASYGDKAENGGFFRVNNLSRVLLFRFELWQNGVMVGSRESSWSGLGKYELPKDWHVWKKYPQKFKYVDAL